MKMLRTAALIAAAVSTVALGSLAVPTDAEAKFRGGFRSSSSFSRSYSTPKTYRAVPKPAPRSTTVYNRNTTVVQQRSGGGFFSSMIGSMTGMAIYQWLFDSEEQKQQQTPVTGAVPSE